MNIQQLIYSIPYIAYAPLYPIALRDIVVPLGTSFPSYTLKQQEYLLVLPCDVKLTIEVAFVNEAAALMDSLYTESIQMTTSIFLYAFCVCTCYISQ